jgi:6-pyruvoyltetrahydropterin/6-carboxytetrahydropterin synthase
MGRFVSTKTYDHNEGLTCAFRQWKSKTDKRFLHGFSLHVKMVFECVELDEADVALDLNTLGEIEKFLHERFDHTTCVAEDDPELETFKLLDSKGAIQLRILPGVGCERFAELIWHHVNGCLQNAGLTPRINIRTVEVREHQANSQLFLF